MDLWCIDCIRNGNWTRADTLLDGSSLCFNHALDEERVPATHSDAYAAALSSTPRPT